MARVVLAKVGTDAHDAGIRLVAQWLREAGHEVIYAGLYNTPERVVRVAVEEDANLIGVSFLGGEPVYLCGRLRTLMATNGLDEVPLVVGGVVTPEMTAELQALGVKAVFTPGTRRAAVLDTIAKVLARP